MATKGQNIVSVIKQQVEQFGPTTNMIDIGTVIEVSDGIARIHGLRAAKYNELLRFPNFSRMRWNSPVRSFPDIVLRCGTAVDPIQRSIRFSRSVPSDC